MKRIVLISIFFTPLFYAQPCFQPADGMNLWRMTAEMGSCLDIVLCSVGSVVPIMQTDLASPYVITDSAYYKVCENLTSANPITISSNDVVLDLGSFFLDGVSIIVSNGVKNVVIKNGTIENVAQGITIGSSTQNIAVHDITLDTAIAGGTTYGIQVSGPMIGLTLSDISFYDAAPQHIVLAGSGESPITNVFIEDIKSGSTNQGLSATFGTDATINLAGCFNLSMNNVLINNPFRDIDTVLITNGDALELVGVNITSDLSTSAFVVSGIHVVDSSDVDHKESSVAGLAFQKGFSVNNTDIFGTISNISYEGCSVVEVAGKGFSIGDIANGLVSNVAYQGCSAVQCTTNGFFILLVNNVTCADCTSSYNGSSGLDVNIVTTFNISGHTADYNGGPGIHIVSSAIGIVKDGILTFNDEQGLFCDTVDNIVVTDCTFANNGSNGLHIKGVNGGNMPSDPEGTVGRSPVLVKDSSSIENNGNGFYFTNVGGVLVDSCFAAYNINDVESGTSGNGFWFDSGSWNAQAQGCTALSNGGVGFITWDVTVVATSLYSNRYRNCYAGNNMTVSLVDPLGGGDFAQGNTPFLETTLPMASIYPSSTLGLPDVALFGAVSPLYCIYA